MASSASRFSAKKPAAELAFLNDWPCGTPKSFDSDFTSHWDGRPSCMATKSELANARNAIVATRTVEEQRPFGRENVALLNSRKQISIDPKPQQTADKIAKLVGRANHQRSQ